jgi:hypothetical protein
MQTIGTDVIITFACLSIINSICTYTEGVENHITSVGTYHTCLANAKQPSYRK